MSQNTNQNMSQYVNAIANNFSELNKSTIFACLIYAENR